MPLPLIYIFHPYIRYIYNYYIDDTYCIYNFEYYNEISKFIIDNMDDDFDINKDYGYIKAIINIMEKMFLLLIK